MSHCGHRQQIVTVLSFVSCLRQAACRWLSEQGGMLQASFIAASGGVISTGCAAAVTAAVTCLPAALLLPVLDAGASGAGS